MRAPSSLLEGMPVTRHIGKHKLLSVKAAAGADVIIQVTLFLSQLYMMLSHGSSGRVEASTFSFCFVCISSLGTLCERWGVKGPVPGPEQACGGAGIFYQDCG